MTGKFKAFAALFSAWAMVACGKAVTGTEPHAVERDGAGEVLRTDLFVDPEICFHEFELESTSVRSADFPLFDLKFTGDFCAWRESGFTTFNSLRGERCGTHLAPRVAGAHLKRSFAGEVKHIFANCTLGLTIKAETGPSLVFDLDSIYADSEMGLVIVKGWKLKRPETLTLKDPATRMVLKDLQKRSGFPVTAALQENVDVIHFFVDLAAPIHRDEMCRLLHDTLQPHFDESMETCEPQY